MNRSLTIPARRGTRIVLAAVTFVVLALHGSPTHAQWGYGGWGGWGGYGGGGSTVQGSIAQGMGALAVGVGRGNEMNAEARAINANTAMQWNQYMFQSQQEANRRYQERQIKGKADLNQARAEIANRLRNDPTPSDIFKGDAMNAALDEINDPRVYLRNLKGVRAKLPGTLIRDIPFQYASAAITTSVEQVVKGGPPAVLKTDTYATERAELKKLGAEIRAQDEEKGKPDPATLQKARDVITALRAKVDATIPKNTRDRREADNYLKSLFGLMKLLESPAIDVLLAGVDKRPDTTLYDLLGFMQAFNFRFGVANTPRQKEVYQQLYPQLVALRDEASQSLAQAQNPPQPPAPGVAVAPPAEIFAPLELDQLDPRKNPSAPK